jgi:hypothetical protein
MPGETSNWPRHVLADVTLDAFFRRMSAHQQLLIEKGGFQSKQAVRALNAPDPESKEQVAVWLSSELNKLREGERRAGAAPMRWGQALPRAEMADLAMTMLEACEAPPGENLICLLQELLDVDRHRKALAEKPGEEFVNAAYFEAANELQGRTTGVREIARKVSVSPAAVSGWKKLDNYLEAKEVAKRLLLLGKRIEAFRNGDPQLAEGEVLAAVKEYVERKDPDNFYHDVENILTVVANSAALEDVWKGIEPTVSTYLPPDQEALRALYQKHRARLAS